jgi:nucleotide-binding universal stress UspA family protein
MSTPFGSILCAVDGSRGSGVAVEQAIALCGSRAHLRFVAISHELTSGKRAQVDLSEKRAQEALDEAARLARQAGIEAGVELLHGAPTADLLLAEAEKDDLLVIGCRDIPRHAGIALGSTATQLAHRSQLPLLIARDGADAGDFPRSILLATDGSPQTWAAARAAAGLARSRGSQLRVVYVPDGMHPERYREVLNQVKLIEEETGTSPHVTDTPGHVADQIDETARAMHSSLIVIGKRGLSGVRALGSVSERVVHKAPSSVLVVPSDS